MNESLLPSLQCHLRPFSKDVFFLLLREMLVLFLFPVNLLEINAMLEKKFVTKYSGNYRNRC